MDYDADSVRLPYLGWEVRSHLTNLSIDGTVAAGAMLYFAEACKCHLISCRQFTDGGDAIRAIQVKATQWIDAHEPAPESTHKQQHDEPSLLS
ncbi:hypothetical protein QTI66_27755 [Variovorax sp. J22R133]|uniref:hypothetical protein n=1 Tax=Variovorax brevis TaxID=3053503 RepID=UPI00257742F7|nr:hypothetical protein [Variovorax sp. J22R133]MDM0115975.1 hypothetical protein [Variovorax sp. J22R133]